MSEWSEIKISELGEIITGKLLLKTTLLIGEA